MSASQVLQQLYSLDPSSQDFLRFIFAFIRMDQDEKYSSSLEGADLTRLVDFLDNALYFIPISDDVFRRCLRKLRAICRLHTTLPSSHIISGGLTKIGESATASGGFADVWQGDQDGRRVCIKALRIASNDTCGLRKSFFKEAVVWKRLRHPNIVPFLGVTIEPLQFVSEWMPNGTLTHYVTKNPSVNRIALLLDVAEGLNYLHASYTIHGDLKGPNILIKSDGHACLADFGLASIVQGNDSIVPTHADAYTARWTAPEILKGAEKITREADIFSFGMVVMEAFTGKHPLSELDPPSVMMEIMKAERPVFPRGSEGLGFVTPIWHMTVHCWQHDPAHRPTMAAVVEFLRECYTTYTVDPSLSTLSPWKPNVNAGDASLYGVISPILSDGTSPTLSTRTSQTFGSSFSPTQEPSAVTQSLTFNILFPGVARASRTSLDESFSDESNVHSSPDRPSGANSRRKPKRSSTTDESIPGMRHLYRASSASSQNEPSPSPASGPGHSRRRGNTSPKQQNVKEETPPQKSGKARWQGIKAAIMFRVLAKPSPTEEGDRD